MYRIVIFYFILIFLFACSNKKKPDNDEFVLTGKLLNTKSETVYLEELLINKTQIIDSTKLNEEGEFFFKVKISEEGFYLLRIKERNHITLLLKPLDNVHVTGDALRLERSYNVMGSDDCIRINELYKNYYVNVVRIDSLRDIYLASQVRTDFAQFRLKLDSAYWEIFNQQKKYVQKFITANAGSMISVLALYQTFGQQRVIAPEEELVYTEKIHQNLYKTHAKNKHIEYLHTRYVEMKRKDTEAKLVNERLGIGAVAPDFSIITIKGDTMQLSSLRGKTVLLNFWSPRCEDCIALNERLKVRYEKYGPMGFDILNIAVEDNEEFWKKSVKALNMPWHQGNDLKGPNSPILSMYKIGDNVPYTLLLDKEGRIITKGLSQDSLLVQIRYLFTGSVSLPKTE